MKLASIETAAIDWLMKAVMPGLPAYVQLAAGFVIPGAIKKLEALLDENKDFLMASGAIDETGFNVQKLREALAFPFKYHEKIDVKMPGISFFITQKNIEEVISAAESIDSIT